MENEFRFLTHKKTCMGSHLSNKSVRRGDVRFSPDKLSGGTGGLQKNRFLTHTWISYKWTLYISGFCGLETPLHQIWKEKLCPCLYYAYGSIIRLLLAHPSFLFQVFIQKYLVFLESGERYRKVESANKFEESCRISTTISDLVIGGGFFTDQMSTKVKQTKKSDSQGSGHSGQGWSKT